MKRIQLRNIPDPRFPPGTPEFSQNLMAWDEAIRQVIRRPLDTQKGAEIEEIRKGIRVLDALDKAKDGVIELEDADWEHLKAKTQAMQWAFVDKRILQFIDDIMDASETVTLNAQMDAAKDGQVVAQPVG
jgi:hypothetical protein